MISLWIFGLLLATGPLVVRAEAADRNTDLKEEGIASDIANIAHIIIRDDLCDQQWSVYYNCFSLYSYSGPPDPDACPPVPEGCPKLDWSKA